MHTHTDGTRHADHDHSVPDPVGAGSGHVVRGGPPVLDIGGDIGAVVALMDPAMAGSELHLRSEHEPPLAVHTGVWTRPHGSASLTAAVFPELVAGTYWVLDPHGHAVRPVVVDGGRLTEIDLRVGVPAG